ncbi:uncharacterized protein LOC133172286 [Saccostrea echinata]|uniref:uncharacterized protein LOC133172286 n=1 Tax=Saccostrea echinata TaxID=191078 RepID=UPI002A837664|nr:uncharacterized protein LOC133172286 [Saccostrea echinata]
MGKMDMLLTATRLKSLLCSYDEASRRIQLLENTLKRENQKMFNATLMGQNEFRHQYLLRLSIVEGYKIMFLQYHNRTWNKIQELSNLILQSSEEPEITNLLPESPTRGPVNDKMAQPEIENFCLMHRSA